MESEGDKKKLKKDYVSAVNDLYAVLWVESTQSTHNILMLSVKQPENICTHNNTVRQRL